jgi:hypothetical protein
MALDPEQSEFLQAATVGIPRVARAIVEIPTEHRARAWQAAERGYLQTVRESGFEEPVAGDLVAAVMRRLRAQVSLLRIIDGEPEPHGKNKELNFDKNKSKGAA